MFFSQTSIKSCFRVDFQPRNGDCRANPFRTLPRSATSSPTKLIVYLRNGGGEVKIAATKRKAAATVSHRPTLCNSVLTQLTKSTFCTFNRTRRWQSDIE